MDVPPCLVSSGVSLWLYSKFGSMGRAVCFGQLRKNLGKIMALPEVDSFEMGVTQGPDVFVFWVQPVLLHLDPCRSPADGPEPDPGPVDQPCILWTLSVHDSGCAAAAHHWGHGRHLQAAPEPLSSSLQGE